MYNSLLVILILLSMASYSQAQISTAHPYFDRPKSIVWSDATQVNKSDTRSDMFIMQDLTPTAFFCKLEDRLDQKMPIQVRFRLGSLDYVNRLENKY